MGPIQTVEELFDFLRRRAWLIGGLLALGAVLSVAYALSQPHIYRASATLQIETPRVADTLAPSTVEESAPRRLKASEQRILARDNLLRLIETYGLFAEAPALTDQERVVRMREAMQFHYLETRTGPGPMDTEVTGVAISVEAEAPDLAVRLAEEVVQQMQAISREARRDRTRTTAEFFAEREETLAAEIAALEARIAQLKADNDLTVTGALEFRRTELTTLQQAMLEIERDRVRVQSEIAALRGQDRVRIVQRQIDALESELSSLDTQRQMLLARSGELSRAIRTLPAAEQQLSLMESQLERLREQHVLALQNRADAETAHRLELSGQAERLRLLEAPVLPDYPVAPGRKKIAAKGAALSLVLALIAAFVLELRHPVIRTAAQMERELGLVPVVSIPPLPAPGDPPRPRLMNKAAMVGGAGLVVLVVATLGFAAPS